MKFILVFLLIPSVLFATETGNIETINGQLYMMRQCTPPYSGDLGWYDVPGATETSCPTEILSINGSTVQHLWDGTTPEPVDGVCFYGNIVYCLGVPATETPAVANQDLTDYSSNNMLKGLGLGLALWFVTYCINRAYLFFKAVSNG